MNTLLRHGLLLCLLPVGLLRAAEPPLPLDPELDAHLVAALEASYRMDIATARAELTAAQPWAAEHPLVPFGEVLIEWWIVTAAVWEEDEARCQPMLDAIDRSLDAAEARIAAGDPTGEGHLVKGATLGLLGRWHIKNRRWWKAYNTGKQAKSTLNTALEINPQLYDVYSGIGIYDYFVAKLPGIVRWLAFAKQTADPEVGLREMDLALAQGRYSLVGTRAALTLINLRNELDPAAALVLADGLVEDYPDSPFFGSLRMIALYDLNRPAELAVEAERQAALLASGDYPTARTAQVHFAAGLAHFRAGEWAAAAEDYQRAAAQTTAADPYVTWAKLHLGHLADIAGERREAKRHYREVKKSLNRWGTRRLAERYLKTPFDPAVHWVRFLPDV